MEFMPVKVNKAIRSEKKHFFFDFKYLKSRSLPVKHAKKVPIPYCRFNKNTYLCTRVSPIRPAPFESSRA